MSSPTLEWASYAEHKRLLLQVSGHLEQKDSKKIVFLKDLPRELEDKEPWEVLAQLQVRGKSTPEELVRILKVINRHDAAEKVKKLAAKSKKAAPTRKDSGPSLLKLEESLELTIKNCDILVKQMGYLQPAADKGRKTRIQEVVSEAKKQFQDRIERELKYVSGLLNSENLAADNESGLVSSSDNSSSSPPSSPESSSAMPHSPMRQRTIITDNTKPTSREIPTVHLLHLERMMPLSYSQPYLWVDMVNKQIRRRVIYNQLTRRKARKMSILQFKHLGGLCLAYLLSSYPGPRPWPRVEHS